MFNSHTILIVFASLITGIISVAMLFSVYWQAPRQRVNQLFALLMLLLATYSVLNIASRFIPDLGADPKVIFGATNILYTWMIAVLYLFSEQFSEKRDRLLRMFGIGLAFVFTGGVLLGVMYDPPRPSSIDSQGYVLTFSPLGLGVVLGGILFLVIIVARLRRYLDPRPQALATAVAWMVAGVFLLTLRPLSQQVDEPFASVLTFPYNALALGIAALLMGRAVMEHQLFNPLRELNRELQQANLGLQEASRHKDLFLANMSHELRTPLNAIMGYTDLLLQGTYGELVELQQDRMKRVANNADHLLNLINDVLDLSKIDAGGMVLMPTTFNSKILLDQVVETLGSLATGKGLTLTVRAHDNVALEADFNRLKQVMINLVGNAIKFTETGGVVIDVQRQNDNTVRFAVQDTGIGIPRDAIPAIFEAFHQVDASSTRRYQGTGLGLTISHRLVQMHGGKLEVESQLGEGSTFSVVLPLPAPEERRSQ